MTDLEMTKLCAEAMGCDDAAAYTGIVYCRIGNEGGPLRFDPLHDDAQAMALLKKHRLMMRCSPASDTWRVMTRPKSIFQEEGPISSEWHKDDLNRAIVECVAKMQAAKVPA